MKNAKRVRQKRGHGRTAKGCAFALRKGQRVSTQKGNDNKVGELQDSSWWTCLETSDAGQLLVDMPKNFRCYRWLLMKDPTKKKETKMGTCMGKYKVSAGKPTEASSYPDHDIALSKSAAGAIPLLYHDADKGGRPHLQHVGVGLGAPARQHPRRPSHPQLYRGVHDA